MDLLEFMMELGIKYYLEMKNSIPFTTGLDILSVRSVQKLCKKLS